MGADPSPDRCPTCSSDDPAKRAVDDILRPCTDPCHARPAAGSWPTSWLCITCHTRWHNTVTPNMGQRPA